MKFSTYQCLPDPWASATLQPDQVNLGGPDASEALIVVGTREERLELLQKWAEVEGCVLTVGDERPVLVGYGAEQDYRPNHRAGD